MPPLSPALAAVAVALAGVRTGARVLDLTPACGLGPALRAGAGPLGEVVDGVAGVRARGASAYVLLLDPRATPDEVLTRLGRVRAALAPQARVTVCCSGDTSALLLSLARRPGWLLVHAEPGVPTDTGGTLVFAVLRPRSGQGDAGAIAATGASGPGVMPYPRWV